MASVGNSRGRHRRDPQTERTRLRTYGYIFTRLRCVLESRRLANRKRLSLEYEEAVVDRRGITTRWTGAAGACFASNLVRRRLNEIAPPGQLNCWGAHITHENHLTHIACRGSGYFLSLWLFMD